MAKIGMIQEQGDLGLGFEPVKESEQKKVLREINEEHAQIKKDNEK